jgi:hypothetical protein
LRDLQDQINALTAKMEASDAVHTTFIGLMLRLMPGYERKIFEEVRKSISSGVSVAGDAQAAENWKLLSEQYVNDAIDRIEKLVRQLGG